MDESEEDEEEDEDEGEGEEGDDTGLFKPKEVTPEGRKRKASGTPATSDPKRVRKNPLSNDDEALDGLGGGPTPEQEVLQIDRTCP